MLQMLHPTWPPVPNHYRLGFQLYCTFSQFNRCLSTSGQRQKIKKCHRTSTAVKERLCQVQANTGRPKYKLLIDVETHWNSTLHMFQHLCEQHQPVRAALSSLSSDLVPLSLVGYEATEEVVKVQKPFHQATVELFQDLAQKSSS